MAAIAVVFCVAILWAARGLWHRRQAGWIVLLLFGIAAVYELSQPSVANIMSALIGVVVLICLATPSSRHYALDRYRTN